MADLLKPVRTVAGKILGKGEKIDDKIRSARLVKCYSCQYLSESNLQVNRRCKLCKCFVAEKTKFQNEHCPINKW